MPGVGKSTVGVLLAKRLALAFLDTDILIQTGERRSLQQIITGGGIEKFCDLEAEYMTSLACPGTVIATGGSVVYRNLAMAHLARLGTVVYLRIESAALRQRLDDIDARGVVYAPGQDLSGLYEERAPLYGRYAQITVDCDGLTPDHVVGVIIAAINAYPAK
ncbi:MAG: shikimate kinase [Desulfobacterales bacterium]|nr:shikimate kinase [Desulfobacterales bacterium]